MSNLGIDYAWTHPDPSLIRKAGYDFVIRYVPTGIPGKDVTATEIRDLRAAGLGAGFIYESTAERALTPAAGTADAQRSWQSLAACGVARTAPLLCNIGDFAATQAEVSAIGDYYRAFRTAALAAGWHQIGGYATSYIIGALVADGHEGIWWQNAMDDQGVKGDVVSFHASIYQRVSPTRPLPGGGFDENIMLRPVDWLA